MQIPTLFGALTLAKFRFLWYDIIASALAIILAVLLILLVNSGIGVDTEPDKGEAVAQSILGVIFTALGMIVMCVFAVLNSLKAALVSIAIPKMKYKIGKTVTVVGVVLKIILGIVMVVLGLVSFGLKFWLSGSVIFVVFILNIISVVLDICALNMMKKL